MRIKNKYELKNYLGNQRIALIQKSHKKTHTQIQNINNRLIDKKIIDWNNEYPKDIYDPFKVNNIFTQIITLNVLATQTDLQRILIGSKIVRKPQSELEALKIINNVADTLTNLETQRIVKNLNHVEGVLTNENVDVEKYKNMVNKLPQYVSRQKVLQRCIIDEDVDDIEEFEESQTKKERYLELNDLSEKLERYKTHRLDFEICLMLNSQAFRDGYKKVIETKTWIWSTLEKTRHKGMDGITVPLSSPFEVENEITGDIDYLMFPGDVVNDQNNCSNICNCGCTFETN